MIAKIKLDSNMTKKDFLALGGEARFGSYSDRVGNHWGEPTFLESKGKFKDECRKIKCEDGQYKYFYEEKEVESYYLYDRFSTKFIHIMNNDVLEQVVVLEELVKIAPNVKFSVLQIVVPETFHRSLWQKIKDLF